MKMEPREAIGEPLHGDDGPEIGPAETVSLPRQLFQPLNPRRRLRQPGNECTAPRQFTTHTADIRLLVLSALRQQRVLRTADEETLVDDPGERFDPGALQILLQPRGLADR